MVASVQTVAPIGFHGSLIEVGSDAVNGLFYLRCKLSVLEIKL